MDGLAAVQLHDITASKVGGGPRRQRKRSDHPSVFAGLVVDHDDISQGDISDIAHRPCKSKRATNGRWRSWAILGHGDGGRGHDRASGGGASGDITVTTNTRAPGGHRIGPTEIRWDDIAAIETEYLTWGQRYGAGHWRVGTGLIIDYSHVYQRDVPGVAHNAAVSQDFARH